MRSQWKKSFFHGLLLILGFLFLSISLLGCSLDEEDGTSVIPWNKPASWEGAGVLGGMGFDGSH